MRCEYLVNPQGIDVHQPRLSWSHAPTRESKQQQAYRVLVASSVEKLACDEGDLWDSGVVISNQSSQIEYSGTPLRSRQRCFWKLMTWDDNGYLSSWSDPASWTMGLLKSDNWSGQWISMQQTSLQERKTEFGSDEKEEADHFFECRNSPLLRKSFSIGGTVKTAQLSICGLGFHELFLNGQKVGDHVLDPALSSYHRNAHYVTHEIGPHLVAGENVLGVQLANGIYNQGHPDAWEFHNAPWKAFPQMLLQLDIEFEDGRQERVVSDTSWKVSKGPILWDQLRMGVLYDARREIANWSEPGYEDSAWESAIEREGIEGRLSSQMSEPIKIMDTLKPISISESEASYEIDFGQNIAGWVQLALTGPRDTEITIKHGDHDLVYAAPLQTSTYIMKGEGKEVWEPRFSFYGFRKIKVSGLPSPPTHETFTAKVIHTSFEQRGGFSSSNEILNALVERTHWSYIGNFVGIPTDCPHREKNGWTGDAQVAAEIGLLYYGTEAAYTRWIQDVAATKREDGKLPCIVPTGTWGYDTLDGPAWEIAYLMIPWHLYEYRGDKRILETHYEGFKHWLDWYRYHPTANQGQIIHYGIGDWVPIAQETPIEVTSTAYYFAATKRLAAIAKRLGKQNEQEEYENLSEEIRQAFVKAFFDSDTGRISNGSQTAMSCALYHGLLTAEQSSIVANVLVNSIRENDHRLNCGFLGSKYLLRALCDYGYADDAFKLVTNDNAPSWASMIASGNTTLWESFKSEESDNHIFLGDVVAWFISYLAGIRHDPKRPGFQTFIISPEIIDGLDAASGYHISPYGRIQSSWKRTNKQIALNVTVPFNSQARIELPADQEATILQQDEQTTGDSSRLQFLGFEEGKAVYLASSGTFKFEATLPSRKQAAKLA